MSRCDWLLARHQNTSHVLSTKINAFRKLCRVCLEGKNYVFVRCFFYRCGMNTDMVRGSTYMLEVHINNSLSIYLYKERRSNSSPVRYLRQHLLKCRCHNNVPAAEQNLQVNFPAKAGVRVHSVTIIRIIIFVVVLIIKVDICSLVVVVVVAITTTSGGGCYICAVSTWPIEVHVGFWILIPSLHMSKKKANQKKKAKRPRGQEARGQRQETLKTESMIHSH